MAGTGYGTVARNVLLGLHYAYPGEYDIRCLGIGQPLYIPADPGLYPYPIDVHPQGNPDYGRNNLRAWLQWWKPDVLVVNNDIYETVYISDPEYLPGRPFPIIHYTPLDSVMPDGLIPESWHGIIARRDWTVLYQEWSRGVFAQSVPEAEDRMSVIPHGVDTRLFSPGISTRGDPDTIAVGMVGKNQLRKDFPAFLAAMRLVIDECPEVAVYIHTSWRGNITHNIPDLVAAYGLKEHILEIEFPGGRQCANGDAIMLGELLDVYHKLDIHVLAHQGEAWGLPHGEAMASGVPALSTDWAGTREQNFFDWQKLPVKGLRVTHPAIPFLRPLTDIEEMASSIIDLCKMTHKQRVALGMKCRKQVEARYSWESIIPQWHAVIQQVVGKYGAGGLAAWERRQTKEKRGWKVRPEDVRRLEMEA
jgi:glycosyltransferase involved in cell wall biosynthesis